MALADTAALIATLELKDKFSRTARNAESALGRLESKTSTLGKVGSEASRGLQTAGQNLARFGAIAAVGVVGGVTAATRAAIDFEDAFAGIRKTVDEADLAAAGLTFEDLSDSIRAMAREIPIAATELAAIGEAAGALGVAAGDIDNFTEVVAKLGVTTDLTSDQAATAMGHLGTILGLTGQDFENVADSLVALGNDGASTESQIIAITERFAASGKSAGLATEDILALASTAASMGIEVEAAGSSLSRLFDNVTTNIGTSNDKAQAFAESLGLSAAEFREAWERDALGTFQEFLGTLDELDQFQAADLLKRVGITGVRDIRAIKLLAGGMDELNDQLETSRTATGALGEEAAKKFETTASQIQLMKNRLTDVGITIGSAVLPKLNELGKRFGEFLNTPDAQRAIQQFADAIPGVIDDLVGIAKGIPWGAIGSAAQLMGQGAKGLLQAFTSLPPWIQTAVLTGWGLNKLTGGALGNIAGILTKSAFGALRGATPANPVFTKEVGLGGAAGGAPVAGGAGRLGTILKGGLAVGLGAVIGAHVADAINERTIGGARDFAQDQVDAVLSSKDAGRIEHAISVIEDQLNPEDFAAQTALALDINGVRTTLEGQRDALQQQLNELGLSRDEAKRIGDTQSRIAEGARNDANRYLTQLNAQVAAGTAAANAKAAEQVAAIRGTAANTATQLSRIESVERGTQGNTARIAAKDFSPSFTSNVSVNLQAQITAYGISRALQISTSATQTDFTGRGGDSRF